MALPRRRQELAKFILFHDFTPASFAAKVSTFLSDSESLGRAEILNIAHGRRLPSAREIRAIELAFEGSLPINVFLDESMLVHYDRDLRLEIES